MKALIVTCVAFLALCSGTGRASDTSLCRSLQFEANAYSACTIDPAKTKLALFNLDAEGKPYGSFDALAADLRRSGRTLLFAMNAGMYDVNLKPIGLHVEQGRQLKKINRRSGPGNFHMKPNGVFYVAGNSARVLETEAYAKANPQARFASQSGPMLVIDGALHPSFSPSSISLKRRNGVGVRADGQVIFAISDVPVRFYDFARFFRDELKTPNALFFDGSVSSLYSPELGRDDAVFRLGPIIGAVK